MKSYDVKNNIVIKFSKEEKEKLISNNYNDDLIKSLELRRSLLDYIINNDIEEDNLEQYKEIILIIVENLR